MANEFTTTKELNERQKWRFFQKHQSTLYL